jgi:hypothetical protein
MTSRAVVLILSVVILLFEADLLAHRRASSSAVKKVYAVIALPLLIGFVLVVAKRWQSFQ